MERTHTPEVTTSSPPLQDVDLEQLSDEEIESLLFSDEPERATGPWNLSTVSGLSLILVGVVYLLQELGLWSGVDVSVLAGMMPWVAGVFIILLGFGVLSWRPSSRTSRTLPTADTAGSEEQQNEKASSNRLTKSADDKKLAGVCAGIAEYLGLDPTLVRIAFVFGTVVSGGPPFLAAYLALIFVLPKPKPPSPVSS